MLIYEKIVSIELIDDTEMIDIEVDNDHYFFANGILTHNSDSNPDMDDTAESFGLTGTLDFMIAAITNEELEELGQYMMKQLKNRFGDKSKYRRFIVGVDRPKQKLFDVEESAQNIDGANQEPEEDRPVMDQTDYGERFANDTKPKSKFTKFNSLKVE